MSSHLDVMCTKLILDRGGSSKSPTVQDETLANLSTSPDVLLPTLRVTLKGNRTEKTARAIIDTGYQRSYILHSTSMEMEYEQSRREFFRHSLFGGSSTDVVEHETLGEGLTCWEEVSSIFNLITLTFNGVPGWAAWAGLAEEELACRVAEEELACRVAEEELACRVAEEELACRIAEEELACRVAEEELACRVQRKGSISLPSSRGSACRSKKVKEAQGKEAKEAQDKEAKEAQGKEAKEAQGKEAKEAQGKEAKDAQDKEAKEAQGKEAKEAQRQRS
ncbi:hypothetical protein LAZ67_2004155 [Cordylochernes scorpioides]|uniref:Uncharacterized protein n=1 Tax=Cordylochernes scorpioides TaxID=51811 RepID=A0ABY6K587_9ARAC|nr:hypothetical protein LAZ67_2004155 [Cordylochernes scorpioides]